MSGEGKAWASRGRNNPGKPDRASPKIEEKNDTTIHTILTKENKAKVSHYTDTTLRPYTPAIPDTPAPLRPHPCFISSHLKHTPATLVVI